jgi:hypothetical protein
MSLFSRPNADDPILGRFQWKGGYWRGSIVVAQFEPVELRIPGIRSAPDPEALAAAKEVPARLPSLLPEIERALFNHYAVYRNAVRDSREEVQELPVPEALSGPKQVWEFARPVWLEVLQLNGILTVEFAVTVDWDEEHTLAARIQSWRLVELCGSV